MTQPARLTQLPGETKGVDLQGKDFSVKDSLRATFCFDPKKVGIFSDTNALTLRVFGSGFVASYAIKRNTIFTDPKPILDPAAISLRCPDGEFAFLQCVHETQKDATQRMWKELLICQKRDRSIAWQLNSATGLVVDYRDSVDVVAFHHGVWAEDGSFGSGQEVEIFTQTRFRVPECLGDECVPSQSLNIRKLKMPRLAKGFRALLSIRTWFSDTMENSIGSANDFYVCNQYY
jgi:hypothetical protein